MTDDHELYQVWRRHREALMPDWCRAAGVYWETWSLNGEVCLRGLDPPMPGGSTLASCLTWFLRSFASECRRTYDMTKALVFAYTSPRGPTTLGSKMWTSFALAIRDPKLMGARFCQRGGDPDACRRWPPVWLEGEAYDYVVGRDPFPPTRTPRRKLTLLGDERQVVVPANRGNLGARARRAWSNAIEGVAAVDGATLSTVLDQNELGFLVCVLVLVHTRPAGKPLRRPSLEESFRRHERLVSDLAPAAAAAGLPVAWDALWRLPPAMRWNEPGTKPWMRFPALSFVAAARSLRP